MYIKNRRNSSEVKVYSPFQYFCKLKDFCFEIAYFSYTNRCVSYKKTTAQTAHLVFADTQANAEKTKRAVFLPTLDRNRMRN